MKNLVRYIAKKLGLITGKKCEGVYGFPCKSYNATRYRQNTQYHNDEDNFVTMCSECRKENDEYWAEMWRDYRNSVL